MLRRELWSYFKAIESDLSMCQRYVEFVPENFSAYSTEFAKIILLAGSETDSVMREITRAAKPTGRIQGIKDYEPEISKLFPYFKEMQVQVKGTGIVLAPWQDWLETQGPDWWRNCYNKLKHQRAKSFSSATLKNALLAVGGLYLALLHLHHNQLRLAEREEMAKTPILFSPMNHPKDTRYIFAFAGSPFDFTERDAEL